MSHALAEISMSLDGFVTGPNPGLNLGLGQGGDALHTWVFSDDATDQAVLRDSTEGTGAVVMGRKLFDIIDGPHGWSDEVGYGAKLNAEPPLFVVTHRPPANVRLKRPITFVTDGIAAAIEAARPAAGQRTVVIMGGGDVIAQALAAGLVDELRLTPSPTVTLRRRLSNARRPLNSPPAPPRYTLEALRLTPPAP